MLKNLSNKIALTCHKSWFNLRAPIKTHGQHPAKPKYEERKSMDTPLRISRHAEIRSQQRGIRAEVARLIFLHHDSVRHVGGGCRSIFISRRHATKLRAAGEKVSLIEAAIGVILVLGQGDDCVVTAMHACGAGAWRYRTASGGTYRRPRVHCRRRRLSAARRKEKS